MTIEKKYFGTLPDGRAVDLFTLKNSQNVLVGIINYGGTIVSIEVPDKNGNVADITLGYGQLEQYVVNDGYLGALVGRHANRIEGARFELNGKEYQLTKNDGENHLHGGEKGLHNAVWNAGIETSGAGEKLVLTHMSPDGEENYPGNLEIKVEYSLSEENELKIEYFAVSDKDTVVNLTNHAYFNLAGHSSGDVLEHRVYINADSFTPTNHVSIPTGEIRNVQGTAMDFTQMRKISEGIQSGEEQIVYGNGYDHNWVLNTVGNVHEVAAEVYESGSGRSMQVFTTKPGIQFYTGNFLNGKKGKDNAVYGSRQGLCLETQYFPNAMKHKHFPSPILKANEQYHHMTVYKFFCK